MGRLIKNNTKVEDKLKDYFLKQVWNYPASLLNVITMNIRKSFLVKYNETHHDSKPMMKIGTLKKRSRRNNLCLIQRRKLLPARGW